jgi:hypothetical protein
MVQFIILVPFLFFLTVSYSQNLDKKISIKIKNGTIEDAITEISNQTHINFSYSPQSVPVNKKISYKAKNKSIRDIFSDIFIKNGIEYSVVENQIILKVKKGNNDEVKENPVKTTDKAKAHTLSGYIKDKATGEALIGAYIYAKGTSIGTSTNSYGFYSLTIPDGKYNIVFSFIGYKTMMIEYSIKANEKFSAELDGIKTEMKEVEVSAENIPESSKSQIGEMKFTPKILTRLPGFAGELDIVKALQLVPGVKTYGDGSTLFYVRGGNRDQNLILVDDAPIFNPTHLFGFFSALAPDAINDAEVYKGDFPAGFGGKLSSVIDIKVKEGNMKRIGFGGSLGPYTSNLSFEGPFKKEKCSFFISARNSNLNWLMSSKVTERSFKINFFDVNMKMNFKLNDNNRLFVSAYGGQDDFSRISTSTYNTFGIKWNNILGSIRWNHIYNAKLFSNTTVYYSRYNYFLFISKELDNYWKSSIDNMALKMDLTYFLNPNNTLKTGINISRFTSNPGNVRFSDEETQRRAPLIPKYISMEYDLYLSNQQTIGDKIILNYGLRIPVWQNFGPTTVYAFNNDYQVSDTNIYNKNRSYFTQISPEPRISIKYIINKKISFQAGYSRTTQFLQILSNSVSPFTSLEVWVPCGPNIKPQIADQFSVGYFQNFLNSKLNISAEVFYKQFYNTIDYKEHADMLYNPQLEGELRFGKGWSYGIELMLSKPQGNFTGWLSYTYSRALLKIYGVNNDDIYPANYDSPNNFNINLSYNLKRWLFSASWIYMTGNAITTPVAFYYYNGYTIPIYSSKNNDRLPDYHRLDFSVTFRINKPERRFQHSIMLTVYNAYARNNPISINFNKIIDDNGKFVVPADLNGNYELVPTKMYVAGIIPSINYKFKF